MSKLHNLSADEAPVHRPPVTMPKVLRDYCWTVVLLSLASTVYCVAMHTLFHRHYPYDWPFFFPEIRFSDFTVYQDKFQFFHEASFFTQGFPFTYPAPTALLFDLFYQLPRQYALNTFLLFFCVALVLPALLFRRALLARGLTQAQALAVSGVALMLSWPGLLLLDRANIEIFVWITLAGAMWAFSRGKEWTAAGLFGVAASLKLFPFVFLALFFSRKKFPKLVFGAAVFFVVTVASLAILGPTIPTAYRGISEGLQYFHGAYMAKYLPNEGGLDHSILAALKVLVVVVTHPDSHRALTKLLAIYIPATAAGGLLLYFLRIRRMPLLNQVLLLTIISIYFTPFSGDGTLIHLYYSFAMCCFLAIDAWRNDIEIQGLQVVFLCFGYLLATESFLIVSEHRFEGQGKCLALGLLMYCALRFPLGPPLSRNYEHASTMELAYPSAREIEKTG